MRRLQVSALGLGPVTFLALMMTRCGGAGPTGPTRETRQRPGAAAAASLSSRAVHADWSLEIVRAPSSGQSFRVNRQGRLPQPAPKFRFKATAPVDVPGGTFSVQFLTAGGKQCGVASPPPPIPFTANTPRTIDIANSSIVVGPTACAIIGRNCWPGQCRFPLTTTKMRIVVGDENGDVHQTTESVQYRWSDATPSGGGSHQDLTCDGKPVPDTVPCGVPVALCSTGGYSCSDIFPCKNRGTVACRVCPGPLCPPTAQQPQDVDSAP